MAPQIKNVVIVGASGNVGKVITPILLDSPLKISALSRPESSATFDSRVNVIKASYEPAELRKALEGQDAVISLLGSSNIKQQDQVIDAAADAKVKWFIPSDFGSNTNDPELVKRVPIFQHKVDTVKHLRSKESEGLSWTSVITGVFFDWCLAVGFTDINIQKREARVWAGGDQKWSATSLSTIGEALRQFLTTPEALDKFQNRYACVQGLSVSQNEIIKEIERQTGEKIKVTETVDDADATGEAARQKLFKGDMNMNVFKDMILAPAMGPAALAVHEKNPGLDNDVLLPGFKPSLEEEVAKVLKQINQQK